MLTDFQNYFADDSLVNIWGSCGQEFSVFAAARAQQLAGSVSAVTRGGELFITTVIAQTLDSQFARNSTEFN